MKKALLFTILISIIAAGQSLAQYSGSFTVQGNIAYYYPVLIQDLAWSNNKATEFELGRSNIHTDSYARGSLIAKFRIHTNDWGHGSQFIDADIRQFNNTFIGDWTDATAANGNYTIIVWLKGGGTTYYFNSPVNITPVVYDGVAHALPYAEPNGPTRDYRINVTSTINANGTNVGGSIYATGATPNYFAGNVGIGTTKPDQKLTVNGQVHSTSVVVTSTVPADYVFNSDYYLRPLADVKSYVEQNHHLPEVPAAADFKKDGQNLGEMNMTLLKKVEELTLYMIEKDKQVKALQQQNEAILARQAQLEKQVKKLTKR